MREFKTAAREQVADESGIPATVEFKVDDVDYTASRPKTAAWLFLASAAESGNAMSSLVEMSKFLDSVLPDDQAKRLSDRLRDPDDDFDINNAANIFRFLIEEFTGRPTGSQSD